MARRRPQDAPTVIFHQRVANQPCAGCGAVIPLGQQKTWTRIKGQTANYDMECAQRLGILIYRDGQWYRPGYQKPVVPKPANEPFHPRGGYVPMDENFHPAPTPPVPPVVADEDVEFEGVEDDEPEAPAPVPPPPAPKPAPVEKPKVVAPPVLPDWLKGMADALLPYVQEMIQGKVDRDEIMDMIKNHGVKREVLEIHDKANGQVRVIEGHQHPMFKKLLDVIDMSMHSMLIGPCASGKSTTLFRVAEATGCELFIQGPVTTKYDLLGYLDAGGIYHPTPFQQWFTSEKKAILGWEEYDANIPEAILDTNIGLENRVMYFPYSAKPVQMACKDSVAIANANTFGLGSTDDFVGRNRQDAAALDRWVQLQWNYDEKLERMITGNDAWCERVQTLRKNAAKKGLRVVISPRASYRGAKMLKRGWSQAEVERIEVRKSMSDTDWASIQ